MQIMWYLTKVILYTSRGELAPITLFESENERQKIEPVPISLPRASKGLMEQSNRDVMVHSFLPARSSYLRFTCVDRSGNENNLTNYIIFFVSYSNVCGI